MPGPSSASVVIPAHNEQRALDRLLREIAHPVDGGRFEIIVVCNGCTDRSAEVARTHGVLVSELAEPSKNAALERGDQLAHGFPRVYLDADVEISAEDLHRLVAAVTSGGHLASAPARHVPRRGVNPLVRWYYDVWERLPQVSSGLFGRGVVVLAEPGHARIAGLRSAMADDLVLSEAFVEQERVVVPDAVVVVHPPRTVADLLRRRIRVVTGNAQADATGLRSQEARTTLASVLSACRPASPYLLLKVPVFMGMTVVARLCARRVIRAGDFTTWRRDDSSRR
ncbi:glycosyltransferase [Georgenia yuyongxinii]|uniref:Glycosyltransferase n=1 Tax=Georgenia yuyongxinii TaxID=2589797 RepID=A0A552WLD1_9MICO|nr:glycosyltransferase [Georgenia yuyongxinii]